MLLHGIYIIIMGKIQKYVSTNVVFIRDYFIWLGK